MRIYTMTATFGKLEHATLTLKPGLNIIEAPNEWGKSTWCAFLVAMLYGIDSRAHSATKAGLADKTRYEPWSGQLMSGRIELNWQGRDITIERTSKKRSQFRQFRACETATGLPVAELTADNCGQLLLGVEKDVFQRAGFIRLSDMPVTANEALRRRLNALVTTGDESGEADLLAAKLAKLKNTCYANSKTGLLPRAEATCAALEDALSRLQTLRSQKQLLQTRQLELQTHLKKLLLHKDALRYAASLENHQHLAQAQALEASCRARLEALKAQCAHLPDRETAFQNALNLEKLLAGQQALYLDAQLQPQAPQPPKPPCDLPNADPDRVDAKLRTDLETHRTSTAQLQKGHFPLWVAGLGLIAAGAAALFVWPLPGALAAAVGLMLTILGIVGHRRYRNRRAALTVQLDTLSREYGSSDPAKWQEAALRYRVDYDSYSKALSLFRQENQALRQRADSLEADIRILCGDRRSEDALAAWKGAVALWDALADQRRRHLEALGTVRSLEASARPLPRPEGEDTLTCSAADTDAMIADCESRLRQLQQELGHCQGLMDAAGQESQLRRELEANRARVQKLKTTLSALTLAQDTLAQATEQLQKRFAPRISQRAKALFSRMTDGRYERLSLDGELSLHVSAQGEDTLRSALWRSDGTADQLYLALRLAVAGELTPDAPLVLDDALVRFDDTRLQAALNLLQEEASQKQILLFTCQSREQNALRS